MKFTTQTCNNNKKRKAKSKNTVGIYMYDNANAKKIIKQLMSNVDDEIASMHIDQWLCEDSYVKCYVKYNESSNVQSIALLSRMQYDPLLTHSNPYCLNYIYTFDRFRRQGCGYDILKHIKEANYQISAFCESDISEALFLKSKYKYMGTQMGCPLFRYP